MSQASIPTLPRAISVLAVIAVLAASLVFLIRWMMLPPEFDDLVRDVERGGSSRWRAAAGLAAALANPTHAARRRDPALVRRLAALVQPAGQSSPADEEQQRLQVYICRILGEFEIADPLPLLVRIASTEGPAADPNTRAAAMESIAVLAGKLANNDAANVPHLLDTVLAAAASPDARLRGRAAFALGVLGGPVAKGRLEQLLTDTVGEVRYNAATGLARLGDARCVDVLVEMLAAADVSASPQTASETDRVQRATVVVNALRAAARLSDSAPSADLTRLAQAVQRVFVADIDTATTITATEVLRKLQARGK